MTTMDYQRDSSGLFFFLLALAVIVAFSLLHAVERHGSVAEDIVSRCDQGRWLVQMQNPVSGRQARVCKISDGGFGVAVYEANDDLVTAFKNKARTLEDAIRYLKNSGYIKP